MNHDTHYNPGGGGAADAVRNPDTEIQAGDRVRLPATASHAAPIYGTVRSQDGEDVLGPFFTLDLDNGRSVQRYARDVTFHGRPHAAFNKGESR